MRAPAVGKSKGKSKLPNLGIGAKKSAGPKLPTNVAPPPPPSGGPPTLASGGPGAPSASGVPGGPAAPAGLDPTGLGMRKGGKVGKTMPVKKGRR
jgi:hypothetical protein